MAAQGYCVIGFARATRLAGFLLGAALVPAVLIAAAACDPMDFGIGAQADGETAEAASPPPEPPPEPPAELPAVAAPALVAEPPLAKVAAFLPAPLLPREKPALVLTVAAGDTLHGIAVRPWCGGAPDHRAQRAESALLAADGSAARDSSASQRHRPARRAAGGGGPPRSAPSRRACVRGRGAAPRGARNAVRFCGTRPAIRPCGAGTIVAGTAARFGLGAAPAHAQYVPLAHRGATDLQVRLQARRHAQ